MNIGVDGNEANVPNRVGIGEFAYELIKEFSKNSSHKFTIYLKEPAFVDMPVPSESLHYKIVRPKKLWTQFGLPLNLFATFPKPDVFFTPSHYAPRFSPIPTTISIMDVSYLKFPHLFRDRDLYQLQHWTAYSVKSASAIFTISQSSKHDILEAYHIDERLVHVVYPGINPMKALDPDVFSLHKLQKTYGIAKKYILFVGTLQPRKNIVRLIESFSQLTDLDQAPMLVIVGKRGWLYEEILDAPKKFECQSRVKFLELVSDDELSIFYQNAQFLILPSLYEGFGLPVLEAMKNGCPVIVSNISSLPEAGGDAALYVDPNDTLDIVRKMQKLLTNDKLRHELIEKGFKHIKKFSWENSAKEVLSVLEKIGVKK